jgi:hypothetical protein
MRSPKNYVFIIQAISISVKDQKKKKKGEGGGGGVKNDNTILFI